MGKRGPRPWLDLRDYVPADELQAHALERALVKSGCGAGRALRIVLALEKLRDEGSDGLWDSARCNYRRDLGKLEGPPWRNQPNEHMVGYLSSTRDIRRKGRSLPPGRYRSRMVELAA